MGRLYEIIYQAANAIRLCSFIFLLMAVMRMASVNL